MTYAHYLLIAMFVLATISRVILIDVPRRPITKGMAVFGGLFDACIIYLITQL